MTTLAMTRSHRRRAPRVRRRGTGGDVPRPPSQGVRLCLAMLRSALVGSHLALATAVGIGLVREGAPGAASAAVAAALVIVFFASGQAVQLIVAEQADGTGMALVLGSYAVRVAGLGLVLWLAQGHQEGLEAVFRRGSFLLGAVLATTGWLAGVLVAHSRARIFVYDADHDAWREGGGAV